jgi:hypothetical protein
MPKPRTELKNIQRVAWPIEVWRKEAGGFSRAFVHGLIKDGVLPSSKIGGARMILESPKDFHARHRDRRDEL